MSRQNKDEERISILVEQYEKCIAGNEILPLSEDDFELLIEHFESKFEYERAILSADQAILRYSYSSIFYVKMAQLLISVKNCSEARKYYEKALIYDPSGTEIRLLESDLLISEGYYEQAIEVLIDLLDSINPAEKADLHLEIADVHEQRKDSAETLRHIKQCLLHRPDHEEGLNRYWNLIESKSQFIEAEQFLTQLIDRSPYNFLAWNFLGNVYDELARHAEAINAYDFAIAINEEYYYVYWDKALCHEKMKDWAGAREVYEEILTRFTNEAQVRIDIGRCEAKLGRYSEARLQYFNALESITANAMVSNAYYLIGKSFERELNFSQAVYYYKRAVEFQRNRSRYWNALGKCQYHLQQYMESAGSYIKSLSLNESKEKSWLMLARCYHQLEMGDMVIHVMTKAMETLPQNVDINYILSAYLIKYGRITEGLKQLDASLTMEPKGKSSIFALFPELRKEKEVCKLLDRY